MLHVFIINPVAGYKDSSETIRQYLASKDDFEYLVFNSEDQGGEYHLVRRIISLFEDEDIRFYICGGSGSFTNALSALKDDDFKRIEFAHYPCGITNDYIKNFGSDSQMFYDIENLINGETIKVDLVKNGALNDNVMVRNYVIFFNIGLAERVDRYFRRYSLPGRYNLSFLYLLSGIKTMFTMKPVEYNITIDGEDYSGKYLNIYVGNGVCFSGCFYPFKSAYATDGYQEIMLLKDVGKTRISKYMAWFKEGLLENKNLNDVIVVKGKKVTIERKDRLGMYLNVDGETVFTSKWEASIVQNGLRYVVPEGVRVKALRDIIKENDTNGFIR